MRRSTRIFERERARTIQQGRDCAVGQVSAADTQPLADRKRNAADAGLDADNEVGSLS